MTQQLTHFKVFREPFEEKMQKLKSVFGLHRRVRIAYEPIPWGAQCDPKSKKKNACSKYAFFVIKICETF